MSVRRRLAAWSARHARGLERVWARATRVGTALEPLVARVGRARLERPVAAIERTVKGAMFDCRMCGRCILSATGMSCAMTCPKRLRNGPCGGVRADGGCEVEPALRCVWVAAWEGSRAMAGGDAIGDVQPPVDHRLQGSSAWLAR